jgi:hypothetical protein
MRGSNMDPAVGSNLRGVIAAGANFVRADLGDCDVTNADFTEAVIDRYQAIQLCDNASGTNPFTGGAQFRHSLGSGRRESATCPRILRYLMKVKSSNPKSNPHPKPRTPKPLTPKSRPLNPKPQILCPSCRPTSYSPAPAYYTLSCDP